MNDNIKSVLILGDSISGEIDKKLIRQDEDRQMHAPLPNLLLLGDSVTYEFTDAGIYANGIFRRGNK